MKLRIKIVQDFHAQGFQMIDPGQQRVLFAPEYAGPRPPTGEKLPGSNRWRPLQPRLTGKCEGEEK